jgi:hypothetical protein
VEVTRDSWCSSVQCGLAMPRALRPNLYRAIKVRTGATCLRHSESPLLLTPSTSRCVLQVVMTDGSTYTVPSAVRLVGNTMQLERDPANHPVYLVRLREERPTIVGLDGPRPGLLSLCKFCVCPVVVLQGISDQSGLLTRRDEARLKRIQKKRTDDDIFD